MKTIEEIKAEIEKYTQYEDVPKELRKEYQDVSLQIMQQEESEIYNRKQATKGIPFTRLEEICEAERLIKKTVYKITSDSLTGIEEMKVTKVILTKGTVKLYAKCVHDDWGNAHWEFKVSAIGKTVFLTKEAAEQALKGGALK